MFNHTNPIAWTGLGASWGGTFAQITSYGLDRDTMLSLAGSLVAAGAVVLPALLRWYRDWRSTRRDEDAKDQDSHATQLAAEVIRRAEAEAKIVELQKAIAALRAAAQAPIPEPSPLQDGRQEGDTSQAKQQS